LKYAASILPTSLLVGGFPVFPELSNSGSPPAQPGVYSGEIKAIRISLFELLGIFSIFEQSISDELVKSQKLPFLGL